MLLNVRPSLPAENQAHVGLWRADKVADLLLRHRAGKFANLANVGFRKFRTTVIRAATSAFRFRVAPVFLALGPTALAVAVALIVGVCAEPKVSRVDAPSVIAGMAYDQTTGDCADVHFVGRAVGVVMLSVNLHAAVAAAHDVADPSPATRFLADAGPKLALDGFIHVAILDDSLYPLKGV
jgi:hypothetical protein